VLGMMEILESAITSPWAYLVIFVLAALDGFFPVVPAETAVITAGVFAATGQPDLLLVIAVAALGAFAGDHISYQIGSRAGRGFWHRLRPGSRAHRMSHWAADALSERGGMLLVVARYIPGGRTAVTLTAGVVAYPRRRFAVFDAIAALTWAGYSTSVGYLGGRAFEDDRLKSLLLGLGIAGAITVLAELIRHLRCLHPILHPQPDQDLADVTLDRSLDQEELLGDLGVGHSCPHQSQHLELALCQFTDPLPRRNPSGESVGARVGEKPPGDSRGEVGRPCGHCPHHGEQIPGVACLVQEPAHPGRERPGDVLVVAEGGQDRHGCLRCLAAQALGRGEPVPAGHPDAEHHDVGPMPQSQLDGPMPVTGLRDHRDPRIATEDRPDTRPGHRLVVGHQHPDRRAIQREEVLGEEHLRRLLTTPGRR
jgi:membrane-associated protein